MDPGGCLRSLVYFLVILFGLFGYNSDILALRNARLSFNNSLFNTFHGSVQLIAEDDRKAWGKEFGETQLS